MRIVQDLAKSLRRAQNLMLRRPADVGFRRTADGADVFLPLPTNVLSMDRGVERIVSLDGQPHLRKLYKPHPAARACLQREFLARQLFADHGWAAPIVAQEANALVIPAYPENLRLGQAATRASADERRQWAEQALEILFDIFAAGWVHHEPMARHFVVKDGSVLLTNFERITPIAARERPPFFHSPDIVAAFNTDTPDSLAAVLGVQAEEAFGRLQETLLDDLHDSSKTFRKYRGRHTCKAQKTYGSFCLPYLSVPEERAQRRSARRFENFGIQPADIAGRSVLDLGSNIGAITFELQKYQPAYCIGVEYDADKVDAAQRVAALHGLGNVTFLEGDIDTLTTDLVGGSFDVVFCLAIEAHVSDRKRLFRLLGEVTGDVLYFEGNNITDIQLVQEQLRSQGFTHFESRGISDDDSEVSNHNRPLLVARKT